MTGSEFRSVGIRLKNAGRFAEAISYFQQAIDDSRSRSQASEAVDWYYLGTTHLALRDYKNASHCFRQAQAIDPENPVYGKNLASMLYKLGRYDEAIEAFASFIEQDPNDWYATEALACCYHYVSRNSEAIELGCRALELKDRLSCSDANPAYRFVNSEEWQLNEITVPAFDNRERGRNVISYSLWGDDPKYLQGALANATIAPVVYPAWVCRFYCDETVPGDVRSRLAQSGAQVVMMPTMQEAFAGLFWRFHVTSDVSVQRYLIRDVDSPLTCQERVAVDEWIESGELFHLIRDWYTHTELILAGLWGGVRGALPDLDSAYQTFYQQANRSRTIDQQFLRWYVWPLLKDHHLAHDEYFHYGNAVDFSSRGRNLDGMNVGQTWQGFQMCLRRNAHSTGESG